MWERIILELHRDGWSAEKISAYLNHALATPEWVQRVLTQHFRMIKYPVDSSITRKPPTRDKIATQMQARVYYALIDYYGEEELRRILSKVKHTRGGSFRRREDGTMYIVDIAKKFNFPYAVVKLVTKRYFGVTPIPDYLQGQRSYYKVVTKKKRLDAKQKKAIMESF